MPDKHGGIGSEVLEQGGPSLGNDYARNDLSIGNAGDALSIPNTMGLKEPKGDEGLAIDDESSRDLSDDEEDVDDSELLEDDFDDVEDDEDFNELDEVEEDEEDVDPDKAV